MGVSAVTAYRLADFAGAISAAVNRFQTEPDFAIGTGATLGARAMPLRLALSEAGEGSEAGGHAVLAETLFAGGQRFAAGTRIEPGFSLIAAGHPPLVLTAGRIPDGGSGRPHNALLFASRPLVPGQSLRFVRPGLPAGRDMQPACFSAGTPIATPEGDRPVESLRPGDLVCTLDGPPVPLRWLGRRQFGPVDLMLRPELRPLRIGAHAFGPGRPARDIVLSARHRVLARDLRAARLFGSAAVLAPAGAFAGAGAIGPEPAPAGVDYCHLLFDRHEVVRAGGLWAESLLLDGEALGALDADARDAIAAGLAAAGAPPVLPQRPAYPRISGADWRRLAATSAPVPEPAVA
jgi:hypothetical protein